MVYFPLPSSHPVPLSHHASSFPNSTTNSAASQACGHQVPLGHQASNFPNSTTNSAASQACGHQVPLGHQASNFPNSTTNFAASQACGHVSQWTIVSKIKACKPVHLSIIVRTITSRIRENYIGSVGCVNRWSTTEKKWCGNPSICFLSSGCGLQVAGSSPITGL
jgi:hypothetical protein